MTTVRSAKSNKHWSERDLLYLTNFYGHIKTEYLAKSLNRTICSINCKANKLGLKIPVEYYMKYPCKSSDKGYVANGYKRRANKGKKIQEHIKIWLESGRLIPKGYQIHHIDFNKQNNSLDNLECLSPKEHRKRHRAYDYSTIKDEYYNKAYSMNDLAVRYNTSSSQIHYIIHSED
jgi:hypothetical protein